VLDIASTRLLCEFKEVNLTREQHLLLKLSEECTEVGKVVHKAVLFGLDDGYPGTDRTNLDDLRHELNDLFAVVEMLYPVIEWRIDSDAVKTKKAKVEHWIKYAQERGILDT